MSKGNTRSTSNRGVGETPPFDCDVGLGLKMQHQVGTTSHESCSHPSKRPMTSTHFPTFQPLPHHPLGGSAFSDGGGIGFLDGGTHFSTSTTNQLFAASLNDTYDATFHPGEAMRAPFTTSQWHELERQNMIFKYLTAYHSVPAHLILPFSANPNCQTNNYKFSSGSDPEPWRCRRTDGKKWRCTRDVAADQKYCERHAHKSRPRSRKHVEIQSHKVNQQNDPTQTLKNPISKGSSTTYDQTRSIEWLMKGGTCPGTNPQVSTCTQEQILSSARMELSDRDYSSNFFKNPTVFQQQENDQDKQENIHLSPFMGNDYYPYFDPKVMTSSSPSSQRSPTRHFIDAWQSDEISNKKGSLSISSGSKELPLSSLTLSMSGGDGMVGENENDAMKSQWTMNNVSWMNSTGGPLGEALCLANAGTRKGASELPSSHCCSNSCSNTTSSCSKGSCEEGNHHFNFIG